MTGELLMSLVVATDFFAWLQNQNLEQWSYQLFRVFLLITFVIALIRLLVQDFRK